MAGSEAEQEHKRAAAAAYDYEGDARWADYWSNVFVPPHLASRPDVVNHFKRKFYQRYIVSILTEYLLPSPPLMLSSPSLASFPCCCCSSRPRRAVGSNAVPVPKWSTCLMCCDCLRFLRLRL